MGTAIEIKKMCEAVARLVAAGRATGQAIKDVGQAFGLTRDQIACVAWEVRQTARGRRAGGGKPK